MKAPSGLTCKQNSINDVLDGIGAITGDPGDHPAQDTNILSGYSHSRFSGSQTLMNMSVVVAGVEEPQKILSVGVPSNPNPFT